MDQEILKVSFMKCGVQ